ncbi:hypothetical protein [Caballeronia sordidicola]|uniref:hypothetical protein n=1 Tax=Caballeronia sordidicola TaxID=196367 RepID=UPI00117E0596|nr:hypothetical protein [Caballeronia sordidicola]
MSISKTLTKNAGRIAWTVCGSTRRETLETDARSRAVWWQNAGCMCKLRRLKTGKKFLGTAQMTKNNYTRVNPRYSTSLFRQLSASPILQRERETRSIELRVIAAKTA